MKRIISFLMVLTLLAGAASVFSGCSQGKKADNVLRVGYEVNFEPMTYRVNGVGCGYLIDIMAEAANRMGMDFEAVPYDWGERRWYLKKDKINCFLGYTCDDRVTRGYEWSTVELLSGANYIYVPVDSPKTSVYDIQSDEQIASLHIQESESAYMFVGQEPNVVSVDIPVCEFKKLAEALDSMKNFKRNSWEDSQAIALNEFSGEYIMRRYPGKYRALPEKISITSYSVGTDLTNSALLPRIDAALAEMAADGTTAKISQKWFGKDITKK